MDPSTRRALDDVGHRKKYNGLWRAQGLGMRLMVQRARTLTSTRGLMQRLPLIVLLVALPLTGAAAQVTSAPPSPWPVSVGDRVRIALPRGGDNEQKPFLFAPLRATLDGRVVRQTSDSLYVQQHPDLMPVAVSQATAPGLYITRGRSRTRSALSYAIMGAVAGLTLARLAQSGPSPEQTTVDFYAPYAAAGAGLGVLHGIFSPAEFWRRVR